MAKGSAARVAGGRRIGFAAPAVLMVGLLTCHWGWEHLVLYAPFIKNPLGTDVSSWFLANLSAPLFTCIMLAFSGKLESCLQKNAAFYFAAACAAVGTCGMVASSLSTPSAFLSVETVSFLYGASNLLSSFGVSLCIFLICAAFARVSARAHEPIIDVATLTGLVVYVFVDSLPFPATYALVLLLPLGSCVLYRALVLDSASKRPKGRVSASGGKTPGWQLGFLLVSSMSINFLRGTHAVDLTAGDQKAAFFALITLVTAVSFAAIHLVKRKTGFSIKPLIVFALALACVLLDVSSFEGDAIQEVIVFSAFFLYVSYLYGVLSSCAASCSRGMFRALAVISLFNQMGLILGRLAADASLEMMLVGGTDYLVVVLLVLLLHLTGTIAYLFKSRREKVAIEESDAEVPPAEDDEGGPTLKQLVERNCRMAGESYGLTPREVDALILLAEGKSLTGVSEGLGVSVNTAKSHISRLYRKLEVHTKEEAFAIVMQMDQGRRAVENG